MARREMVPASVRERLKPWYTEQMLDTTPVLSGSLFGWLFGRFGQHAVTVNKTVHLTSRAPDLDSPDAAPLLGHECYHVLQQRETGWWRFLARYLWRWRPFHINNGRSHPLEAPACLCPRRRGSPCHPAVKASRPHRPTVCIIQ